nr:hypothetical protein [Phyllobacterium sp. A18/5-2]
MQAAAEALQGAGVIVEPVRIPALERDNALDIFNALHMMEMKPAFAETTWGHENEMYKISKGMLATPDTSMDDFIHAEQAAERLRDGLAEYFQRYDALLCPVLPIPHTRMGCRKSSTADQYPPCRSKAPPCRST